MALSGSDKLNKLKDEFGGCCLQCGETRYHVLEFHHTNPREHSKRPSWTVVRSWGWSRIQAEYGKETILVCRNCHGDIHHMMKQPVNYQDD